MCRVKKIKRGQKNLFRDKKNCDSGGIRTHASKETGA